MKLKRKLFFLTPLSLGLAMAPIAVAASCGSEIPVETTKPENTAFDGSTKTIQNILDQLKSQENTPVSTSLLNEVKAQTTEALYEREFKASKQLQLEYFAYDQIDLVNKKFDEAKKILVQASQVPTAITTQDAKKADITRAVDLANQSANTTNTVMKAALDAIKAFETQEKTLQTKIDKLNDDVANVKGLDYSSGAFSTDYPRIITPLTNIRTNQTKTYNEARTAFIETYATKPQGEAAWINERASKYGGATNDDDAIKYLVTNSISAIAFGRYKYAINSDFTVQQVKSGVFSAFAKTGSEYVFNTLGYYTKDATIDTGKVYFLGRSTRDASLQIINPATLNTNTNNPLKVFATQKTIGIQHALIDIKAGTGNTLPWTVTKATIKNLLSYYGNTTPGGKKVFDLWKNMFQDATKVETEDAAFLKFFSNNEETTKEKAGNLGVNSLASWVQSFDAGFGLGMVAAQAQDPAIVKVPYAPEIVGYKAGSTWNGQMLLDQIGTDLFATISSLSVDTITTTEERNRTISQYIDNLSDADFNQRYGVIFQKAFTKDAGLVYEINQTENVYLVTSSFGIHIIKLSDLSQISDLQSQLGKDLSRIAKDENTANAVVDWGSIFGQIYTDNEIVRDLLSDTALMSEVKLDSSAAFKAANSDKWTSWINNGYIKEGEEIITKVRDTINNITTNNKIQTAIAALNGKASYLIDKIDNRFLPNTIKPSAIYNAAIEEMGVNN